jgi:hypothetical protein
MLLILPISAVFTCLHKCIFLQSQLLCQPGSDVREYFIPFYVVPCIAARGAQRCTVVPSIAARGAQRCTVVPCIAARGAQRCTVVLRTCGHYYCYYAKFVFVSTVRGGPLKPAVCPVTEQIVHHTSGPASRCGCSAPVDAASCCKEKFNSYPCVPAASHVTPRPTYAVQGCLCCNGPGRFLLVKRVPGFPQALSSQETASGYVCAVLGRCVDG